MRPFLKRQRARGVDADDRDLGIDERRLELGLTMRRYLPSGLQEALPDPVQRHVVIARHDDARRRQPGEERTRGLELARRARCVRSPETTTTSGPKPTDGREQRLDQRPDRCGRNAGPRDEPRCASRVPSSAWRTADDAQRGGSGAIDQGRRHDGDLAVGRDAQAPVPALDDDRGWPVWRRSRAPAGAGRRARAARAAGGAGARHDGRRRG